MRNCHFCKLPIPDDERGIEATTKNGWAHFECWYDGAPFKRDPETGALADREQSDADSLADHVNSAKRQHAARVKRGPGRLYGEQSE